MAVLGHILNAFWKHKNFIFNQYFLMGMLIIQLFVIKKIDSENKKLEYEIKKRKETEVWGCFHKKNANLITPLLNTLLSLLFVFIYIFTMFKVGCLEPSPTGLYGGLLGGLVFYVGIQAYLKYIALLYFVYDLKEINIKHYFFYYPAITDWFVRLARMFSYIEKWFLALGLMYTLVYAINIPPNSIILKDEFCIQTPSPVLFIITWIGILVFFAIAVPVFTLISRHYLKECICSCKSKSIKTLEMQIEVLSQNASEKDINTLQAKLSLIKEISTSDEYPLKYSHTVFHSIYTIGISLITLASPFVSIIEQFIIKS